MIKVLDVNNAVVRIFWGKDKKELINNLHEVFVPESAKSLKETIIAIAEGKTYYKGESINKTLKGKLINTFIL